MARREERLMEQIKERRAHAGISPGQLPILRYHFDVPAEREFCARDLGIGEADLLFAGLVQVREGIPVRVLYRESNIDDLGEAAQRVITRGYEVVAVTGQTPSPTPTATSSPEPSPQVTESPLPETLVQWETFAGEGGFTIRIPRGWSVKSKLDQNPFFIWAIPEKSDEAVIVIAGLANFKSLPPVHLVRHLNLVVAGYRNTGKPEEFIARVKFKEVEVLPVSQSPFRGAASFTFTDESGAYAANAMGFSTGKVLMYYSIAAKADRFARLRPILLESLSSYSTGESDEASALLRVAAGLGRKVDADSGDSITLVQGPFFFWAEGDPEPDEELWDAGVFFAPLRALRSF
jgi:hypothetical protein